MHFKKHPTDSAAMRERIVPSVLANLTGIDKVVKDEVIDASG